MSSTVDDATPFADWASRHWAHQPGWPRPEEAARAREALTALPALVKSSECEQLLDRLAEVSRRQAVVLHAGDCAEMFADSTPSAVLAKAEQLHDLSAVLRGRTGLATTVIGRIAGQYAKPRSEEWEKLRDGTRIRTYRGDAVNGSQPSPRARTPDPERLRTAYDSASAVLKVLRELNSNRSADERIFTSHEALLLDYELPLLRSGHAGRFASSGHLLWIGDRTRTLRGAHAALAGSVTNPVAVKLGPSASPADAVRLSLLVNPDGLPGKLTFITRMGAAEVDRLLPDLVANVARHGAPVGWLCDPMHGNTMRTRDGLKTRSLSDIRHEAELFVQVMREHGQWPGGLHLETTPDAVTECVPAMGDHVHGGTLPGYRAVCDPRLNPEQAAEIVEWFAGRLG